MPDHQISREERETLPRICPPSKKEKRTENRISTGDGTVYEIDHGLNCPHIKSLSHNYHPESLSMDTDSSWSPRIIGISKSKSNFLSDLHNLQVTGSNSLQSRSGMWEVNKNGYQNEARHEMVRLSLDSAYSLLRSDFGFRRRKTELFEGISRQNVFPVESLEEKFRRVASRHLEALQTRGSRLPASEADCAISRLRRALGPAKVNGDLVRRFDYHLMPVNKEKSDRKRDRKEKGFTSRASGFKTNLHRQLTKNYFHTVPKSQSTKGNQILIVNGANIAKKKQL